IYATTSAESAANRIIKVSDSGPASPAVTIATAGGNTVFRGLEWTPVVPIALTCSSNITVTATSPSGAVVTYASSATGGCPPRTVTCNPPSGRTFPVGTTTVTCTACDTCGTCTNCTFTITVLPQTAPEYFSSANVLPPPSSMYISPALWHILFNNG